MDHWGGYRHKLQKFLRVLYEAKHVQEGRNNLVDFTFLLEGGLKGKTDIIDGRVFTLG